MELGWGGDGEIGGGEAKDGHYEEEFLHKDDGSEMAVIITITATDYSYPYNVHSRSIVQVVGDHLFGLLLGRDVSGMDRQLSIRARPFTLG